MAQIQLKMKRHLHNSFRALFLSIAVLLSLPMLAVEIEIDGINYELVAKIKEATVIAKSSGVFGKASEGNYFTDRIEDSKHA